MITRDTTFHFLVAAFITAMAAWQVFLRIPSIDEKPESKLLINTDIDKVTSFTYEAPGLSEISCRKDNIGWMIERPIKARADDESIQKILDAVAVAPVKDSLTINEQQRLGISVLDCGLLPPKGQLTLRGDSIPTISILIGKIPPHKHYLYVQFANSAKILATQPDLFYALPNSPTDLRDRHLIPAPMNRLRKIELRPFGAAVLSLSMDSTGTWRMKQPYELKASNASVNALLDYIIEARIDRFVTSKINIHNNPENTDIAFGCTPEDSPITARFWFDTDGPTPLIHELIFGKQVTGEPDKVYVFSKEEGLVATVPASLPIALRVVPESLRERRIFDTVSADVTGIEFRNENSIVSLSRSTNETWSICKPFPAQTNETEIDKLLRSLFSLRDTSIFQTNSLPDKFTAKFTYYGKLSAHTNSASVLYIKNENNQEYFDWYFPNEKIVRRVNAADMPVKFGSDDFFASLRDITIFNDKESHLVGATVFSGTNSLVEITNVDGTLQASRSGLPTGTNAISRFEAVVLSLKAESVASLAPPDISKFGLTPPLYTLVISTAKSKSLPIQKTLLIGNADVNGRRFAMLKGQDSVFILSENDSNAILFALDRDGK